MARLKQTARIIASSSSAQPSASAPTPPPPVATSFHDNARVYEWAPLALLVETSTLLPEGHLTSLLSRNPDEPSCSIDRENDFNIQIRIPPLFSPKHSSFPLLPFIMTFSFFLHLQLSRDGSLETNWAHHCLFFWCTAFRECASSTTACGYLLPRQCQGL